MTSLALILAAIALVAPGDKLIRGNLGVMIPNPDDKIASVLSCPFATPGDYATGDTSLCTPATAVTVTRSSNATYLNGSGTITTAAANRLRVSPDGTLIESTATNQIAYSDNPFGAAWANDGAGCTSDGADLYPLWGQNTMDGMTCGATYSARYQYGGAAATAGTAYAWARSYTGTVQANVIVYGSGGGAGSVTGCVCARSDGGTCTATINNNACVGAAVVGTSPIGILARATFNASYTVGIGLRAGGYGGAGASAAFGAANVFNTATTFSSHIPTTTTAATRQADAVSVSNPLTTNPPDFCMSVSAAPYTARSWSALTTPTMLSTGTDAGVDAWRLRSDGSGNLVWDVDQKIGTWAHSYVAGSAHTLVVGTAAGTLNLSSDDGVKVLTISGAGDGIVTTQGATLRLGAGSTAASEWNGSLKNVKLYNVACSKAR